MTGLVPDTMTLLVIVPTINQPLTNSIPMFKGWLSDGWNTIGDG